jgi:hypothetical protein
MVFHPDEFKRETFQTYDPSCMGRCADAVLCKSDVGRCLNPGSCANTQAVLSTVKMRRKSLKT